MTRTILMLALGAILGVTAGPALASEKPKPIKTGPAQIDNAVIEQSRGADPSVRYADLRRFGPWDDRNYELTAADLATLPANDRYVYGVPAFFKVLKRKEMAAQGRPLLDEL